MKVLLIDVNYKNSSTGKIVYDLYNSLTSDGHTVSVCYGRGPEVNESNVYKFSSNLEVYIHAFLTRVTGFTGNYSYFSTKNLINYIKDFNPDVVHIHELHAYFVNIAPVMKFLKENNIKTVWTFHCEFMYTGKCGHAYECEKWKSECGKCPQIKEYPASIFFDFTKKMFNEKKLLFQNFNNLTIVTPSNWLASRVKQSFLKDKKIQVIHNGIDTINTFYPRTFEHLRQKHKLSDEKIVLAVAPDILSEQKGGRLVLELAKKLRGERIKFILIGVEDLNEKFDENVLALGRTTNQAELAEYYSLADLFVICSKRENFPTTCLEAISCGTPVIGFDEGGTKETAPGNYGVFISHGDTDKLAKVMMSVLTGEYKLNSMEKCVKFGKEEYDKNIMYQKYKILYEQMN
jgi:putative colanic acid biosynthesis glycosyltransferase